MTKLERKAAELKKARKIGETLCQKRVANRFKASWVAAEIGISPSLLCLLEKGRRLWTPELQQRYLKAIGEL